MISQAVLDKLEYGAILKRLSARCGFSVAADYALALVPNTDLFAVERSLSVTAEAVELLTSFPDVSVGGARDIRALIEKAEKGGRLQPGDFLVIGDTLRAARELRRLFLRMPEGLERFPLLYDQAEGLGQFPGLEADINRTVGPRGDVLDTASEELGRIRKTVRIAYSRLMERLNGLVTGGRYGHALQENIVTMRDGRYVIPVRADARNVVRGIVHDTSASGQTLFVEPFDVVELNNRWREEQIAEQREIDRILDVLSGKVGDAGEGLSATVDLLAAIDLAFAKARLSFAMSANRPDVWDSRHQRPLNDLGHETHRIRLDRARHPLLDPNAVVPIDVVLGEDYRVLLITGPNTGGKTVALKTVGLLTLMAQTGLYIPAEAHSVVSVFDNVFVDLGDEQSIEQSLSTFSAHMRTINTMLRDVNADSLVLLDELGAGTDPQEGSALARAIISELLRRGPLVIATTHFSEVKAYAYATPGVENASVEFDLQSLAPTYRLMIGIPGRSNALAIAKRLGLDERIVEDARQLLTPDDERAEALIDDIRRRREQLIEQQARLEQTQQEARALRVRAARALREAEERKRDVHAEALAEAEQELGEVKELRRQLERDRHVAPVHRPRTAQASQEIKQAEDRLRRFRRERVQRAPAVEQPRELRPGDRVRIEALGQEGEVVSVSDGTAEVQLGPLKVRQPLSALARVRGRKDEDEEKEERRPVVPGKPAHVPIEIDFRGQRAADVVDELDRYLHDAYLYGLPWVRIIHGKGTGALRNVVREQLRTHPAVERAEPARAGEGGEGATVAHLRQS